MIKLGLSIDDSSDAPAAAATKTGDSDMPPLEEDKATTAAAGDSKMEEVD
jgi:hypothetical protein